MSFNLNYKPDGDVLRKFMLSQSFVRGLQGPIGSGKSACFSLGCQSETGLSASPIP